MIIGYSDLAKLAVTVERELTPPQPIPVATEERPLSSPPPDITPGPPPRSSTPAGTSSQGGQPRHATDWLVVLAGGMGSRLHSKASPKPLVELGGISLVERALAGARQAGFDEVVVVTAIEPTKSTGTCSR